MFNKVISYLKRMKGGEKRPPKRALSKVIWSWFGAFLGIYSIAVLNDMMGSNHTDSILLLGSFGASSVLIYAAPHAEFSQPRNFVEGHFVSALIGVSVYKFLPFDIPMLCATAVSISIVVMFFANTLHPPGGATALAVVIGSPQIHEAGYLFAFLPVLLDSLILLAIALVINNLSNNPKRHYPRYWY